MRPYMLIDPGPVDNNIDLVAKRLERGGKIVDPWPVSRQSAKRPP